MEHARTHKADPPEQFDAVRDGTPHDAVSTDSESGPGAALQVEAAHGSGMLSR